MSRMSDVQYGSWEEWHKRVDEEGRNVNFHVYNDQDDMDLLPERELLKAWMDIHMGYLSLFARVDYVPVSNKQLVQAEASRD